MADSTTNLATISASQAAKETTANELFDAHSPASLFGRNADTTSALTFGYYGGKYRKADGTIATIANGTVSLTASATNYIKETDGVVSKTTAAPSGWPSPLSGGAKALYAVVCDGSGVTSYTDYRTTGIGSGNTAGATSASGVSITDSGGYFTGTDVEAALQEVGASLNATASQPFDIPVYFPGVPTASMKFRFKLARAVTFPANFSGAQFTATANATASTVIDIQKNGSSVGSCTIAAGTTTPTFASSGGASVSFAAGDVIAFICPASPDATLADPAITLAGTR